MGTLDAKSLDFQLRDSGLLSGDSDKDLDVLEFRELAYRLSCWGAVACMCLVPVLRVSILDLYFEKSCCTLCLLDGVCHGASLPHMLCGV